MDQDGGCKTLLLPCMTDTELVEFNQKPTGVRNFIFAGLKQTDFEDDLPLAMGAFDLLDSSILANINIHITGLSQEKFEQRFGTAVSERVQARCIFHGWLEYKDLQRLYAQMHYLVLARKENNITRANFPSKIPELLSYGVVPVCTAVGDYTANYMCDGVDSFICEKNDKSHFAACLEKAVKVSVKEYEELSKNARKLAESRFDYKVWTDQVIKFVMSEEYNEQR